MSALAAAACRNHPDREAIGVCVKCRSRVCSECSTKVDGINHCVACLATLAEAPRPRDATDVGPGRMGVAAGGALLVAVTLMAWALLEIALPG